MSNIKFFELVNYQLETTWVVHGNPMGMSRMPETIGFQSFSILASEQSKLLNGLMLQSAMKPFVYWVFVNN